MKYNSNYTIVAQAKGQEVVKYETFGSYQGEWLMISKDKENYYIYRDSYGSCSGCDSYEAEFGWNEDITEEHAKLFSANYEPFITIPIEKYEKMKKEGTLIALLPANMIDGYDIKFADIKKFLED